MNGPVHHVVPLQWGPYVDVAAMWQAAGATVIDPASESAYWNHALRDRVTRVFWTLAPVPPPKKRTWAAIAVYVEALVDAGRGDRMLPQHAEHWLRFCEAIGNYDAVVVHTPAMARRLRTEVRVPVFTIPLGWSPHVVGIGPPGPRRHVHYDVAWWGSPVGRRVDLYAQLTSWAEAQSIRAINLTGTFGRELVGALDGVACVIHVQHSKVDSYSTWRLWQCLAADVPVVSEPASLGDVWPFEWDTPYLRSIPFLDEPGGWEQLEVEVRTTRNRARERARLYPDTLQVFMPDHLRVTWNAAIAQAFLAFEESRHVQ